MADLAPAEKEDNASPYINNERMLRIHRHDEVVLDGRIGYFPELRRFPLNHGFDWDHHPNYRYRSEPGWPSTQAILRVRGRVSDFLQTLGMAPIEEMIICVPSVGETSIVDITPPLLQSVPVTTIDTYRKDYASEYVPYRGVDDGANMNQPMGRYIEGGAFFTDQPVHPFFVFSRDCPNSFVFLKAKDGRPVVGLVHNGRAEANRRFPQQAIAHAIDVYGANPAEIHVAFTPGLGQANHTLIEADLARLKIDAAIWKNHMSLDEAGLYHLDLPGLLSRQYLEAGLPPENISASYADTYAAAAAGIVGSLRYTNVNQTEGKGFGIAIELKKANDL